MSHELLKIIDSSANNRFFYFTNLENNYLLQNSLKSYPHAYLRVYIPKYNITVTYTYQ